jgi:hypothetical protein
LCQTRNSWGAMLGLKLGKGMGKVGGGDCEAGWEGCRKEGSGNEGQRGGGPEGAVLTTTGSTELRRNHFVCLYHVSWLCFMCLKLVRASEAMRSA